MTLCWRAVPKPEILEAGVMPRPVADYQACGKQLPCPDHPEAVEALSKSQFKRLKAQGAKVKPR